MSLVRHAPPYAARGSSPPDGIRASYVYFRGCACGVGPLTNVPIPPDELASDVSHYRQLETGSSVPVSATLSRCWVANLERRSSWTYDSPMVSNNIISPGRSSLLDRLIAKLDQTRVLMATPSEATSRRQFLAFAAASPLLALSGSDLISSPQGATRIMDFEEAARRAIPIAHWAYLTTGVDDDATVRANVEGYRKIRLRPRRLVDVSGVSQKVELFGTTWESPIYISPCASQKAFHRDGELATARAAKATDTLHMLSAVSSTSVEDVAVAQGRAPWFQLYAPVKWESVTKMVQRVEAAGCPVLVLTVDENAGRNTETQRRLSRSDTRRCAGCHPGASGSNIGTESAKPMYAGLDPGRNSPGMDWTFVDRLRKLTTMKLMIKGLETREDAALAVEHGADGIVCSNHGGRAMDDGRASIEDLPEVLDGAGGRVPVFVDGGVRRGSDAFKALAMGARAVGIGRPYLWGLGAFGQAGVQRVIELLRAELTLTMRQCGTRSVSEIDRSFLA
jgi:4-hydroxymandelate oxidase